METVLGLDEMDKDGACLVFWSCVSGLELPHYSITRASMMIRVSRFSSTSCSAIFLARTAISTIAL